MECVLLALWSHQGPSCHSSHLAHAPNACAKHASEIESDYLCSYPISHSTKLAISTAVSRILFPWIYKDIEHLKCEWGSGHLISKQINEKKKHGENWRQVMLCRKASQSLHEFSSFGSWPTLRIFLYFALFGSQMRSLFMVYMLILCFSTYLCSSCI